MCDLRVMGKCDLFVNVDVQVLDCDLFVLFLCCFWFICGTLEPDRIFHAQKVIYCDRGPVAKAPALAWGSGHDPRSPSKAPREP